MLTESQIRQMMPLAGQRLNAHVPYFAPAMEQGGIVRPKDIASFMAQLAHESGEYRYLEEIASGDDYDQRTDLGNTYDIDGDGRLYKGRTGIQLTGKDAYREFSLYAGYDFVKDPAAIIQPEYCTLAAVWYWTRYKTAYSRTFKMTTAFLPVFSCMEWFWAVTKGVNGAYTHIERRIEYYVRNRQILKLPEMDTTREGERTRVKLFQMENGLSADGDAGPDTAAKAAQWLRCNLA